MSVVRYPTLLVVHNIIILHTAKHYQKVSLLKAYGLPKAIKDIFKHELFSVTGLGKFNLIPLNGKANPLQQICDNSQGLDDFV